MTKTSAQALLNQRPLKLGHGTYDLKHQPTRERTEVEVVPQAHERNSTSLEFRKGIDLIAHITYQDRGVISHLAS